VRQPLQPRIAKRVPCAVRLGQRRFSGVVINISQGGMFVQTSADAGQGANVDLELSVPKHREVVPVCASVVWKRVVPHQLRSVAHGGFGVQITRAAETYYQLLAAWMRVEVPASSGPAPSSGASREAAPRARADTQTSTYRLRVREASGPRSKTLAIEAASAEEAGAEALRRAGAGWRIIDIESA
jgi:Tfp pilus assembly protein PilZ